MAVLGNLPLWQFLLQTPELAGWNRVGLMVGMAVMLAALTASIAALFAWRWTLKPVLTLLLLLCALASHYMLQYGIVVDTPMLINVLQTDVQEARDQLSWRLWLHVAWMAALPAGWVWQQPMAALRWPRQLANNVLTLCAGLGVTLLVLLAVYQDFASLMRNQLTLRYQLNPLNSVYAVLDLTLIPSEEPRGPLQTVAPDARVVRTPPAQQPPLLVIVLGETARSQNFSLNGYARDTNPELAKLPVVSFSQVRSCGTSTAESLPCMFSHLGRRGAQQRHAHRENLLDVLQRAGLGCCGSTTNRDAKACVTVCRIGAPHKATCPSIAAVASAMTV